MTDADRVTDDVVAGFSWAATAFGFAAVAWFGLHAGFVAGFAVVVGMILLVMPVALMQDSARLLRAVVLFPVAAFVLWLFSPLRSVIPGILVGIGHALIVVGLALLVVVGALLSWRPRTGRAPVGLTRSLGVAYEALSGASSNYDGPLVNLGLFRRLPDGVVERPTLLAPVIGEFNDCVPIKPLPGTAMAWVHAEAELRHLWSCPLVVDATEPGVVSLVVQHTLPPAAADPLAAPIVISAATRPAGVALRVGTSDGLTWVDLALADRAGMVVGGQPGSGKTASLRGMVAGLAALSAVQIAVVDGKGGSDWEALSPKCFAYLSTVEDLESVAALLRSIDAERARRVQSMLGLRGTSNFWDHGPDQTLPLIVVVVDECQAFLSKAWHGGKAARDLVDEITSLVLRLVTQGRSAGIFCILATQKPTADNLPTSVRDSAGLKVAYSVATRAAAEAVLGDSWCASESGFSPVGAAQGVAVVSDGLGAIFRIRSPLVPESAVRQSVWSSAALTVDPRTGSGI